VVCFLIVGREGFLFWGWFWVGGEKRGAWSGPGRKEMAIKGWLWEEEVLGAGKGVGIS